jgi:very-short-patch-repair endonuclease
VINIKPSKLPSGYELINYGSAHKIKHKICGKIFEINRQTLYGRLFVINTELCIICNPLTKYTSQYETKLLDFIYSRHKSHNINKSIRNIIPPYELDIYIPDMKLAIEFNGMYWHSEINKYKNYHKIKSDLCDKQGIKLLHIWEYNWTGKQNIIKSIISGYLGKHNQIYARKCKIVELKAKDYREFINNNHLQ